MNLRIAQARFLLPLVAFGVFISYLFYAAQIAAAQGTPGGTITAVNTKTGVVTGKVNSTGQVFTFTLANKAMLLKLHPGEGVFVNLGRKQVSLDGKTASGSILALSPLGRPLAGSPAGQGGSSGSSGSGTCTAAAKSVTICSPISGSTTSSPVQITAAAMSGVIQTSSGPVPATITAMRVFVDPNSTSAYMTNTGSLNIALPMSAGSHNILVRAWGSDGFIFEKSVSVMVNSGSSGSSGSSGTTNPQPVSFSCGTSNPPTADTCGKSGSTATNVGTVTCGSSITITGNTLPAGTSDWFMFQVTTPRENCANLVIRAAVSPAGVVLDALSNISGGALQNSYSYGLGPALGVPAAGLGTLYSPLQPGTYYIRVYGPPSATPSAWTLTITG